MKNSDRVDGLRELIEEYNYIMAEVRKFVERVEVKNSGWDARRHEVLQEIKRFDDLQSSEFTIDLITPDDYSD